MVFSDSSLSFRAWILTHQDEGYELTEEGSRIFLTTPYAQATIRFYDDDIIEYQIIRRADGENVFYLHFRLSDFTHARYLYDQLTESLLRTRQVEKKQILISCSSALTTSYFAMKLNQTAELMNLPLAFTAVSADRLPEEGAAYDMILLAPQIAYTKKETEASFPGLPVLEIPAALFGMYDVRGVLDLIQDNLAQSREEPEQKKLILTSSRKIMAISTRIDEQFRISYRIYHNGEIIRRDTVIKNTIDIHDFEDILDTVSVYEKDIDTVVISMPGIVKNGTVTLPGLHFREYPLEAVLKEKYPFRFVITNNAHATALGIYHLQNDYATVVYHSQLVKGSRGGQGIVVDGKVLTGRNGVAGEINYLLRHDDAPSNAERLCSDIAAAILADIAIVGPSAVFIRCAGLHSVDRIREILAGKVEEKYLPELFLISHSREYMYYGAQFLAGQQE